MKTPLERHVDELLTAAENGTLDTDEATVLRAHVEELRSLTRSGGSLQTRYARLVQELRAARKLSHSLRELTDWWESRASVGQDVGLVPMLYSLRRLANEGEMRDLEGPLDVPGCAFCDLANGRGPAEVIRETPGTLIIKPLKPVVEGHVLVIPRSHVPDFASDPVIAGTLMRHAATYAAETLKAANVITSRGHAATQSVFHLHLHVLPRTVDDGLALPWHSGRLSARARQATRDRDADGLPLTVTQAASVLNTSRQFVHDLIVTGELSTVKVNGAVRVLDTVLLAWRETDDRRRARAVDELSELGHQMQGDEWWVGYDQSGHDTPDCTCGHDGMGRRWHRPWCQWVIDTESLKF